MKPRICRCCGVDILCKGEALLRNPNLCASCSSMADGFDYDTAAPQEPCKIPAPEVEAYMIPLPEAERAWVR
jgi:hypothetical protein